MTELEVFKAIEDFKKEFCGSRPRRPVEERFKKADKALLNVCSQLSVLGQNVEDVRFLFGISYIKYGDPVENMAVFLEKTTPRSLKSGLYSRTGTDNTAVDKFLQTTGMSEKELFKAPVGGQSIGYNLLRTLTITPWCYLCRLKMADGFKLNKDEANILPIVKEITHA